MNEEFLAKALVLDQEEMTMHSGSDSGRISNPHLPTYLPTWGQTMTYQNLVSRCRVPFIPSTTGCLTSQPIRMMPSDFMMSQNERVVLQCIEAPKVTGNSSSTFVI